MPHTRYMTTEEYVFSPANLARLDAIWADAANARPTADAIEEPNDDEATRELTEGELDRIETAYERRLGL